MMHMRIYDEDVQKGEKNVTGCRLLSIKSAGKKIYGESHLSSEARWFYSDPLLFPQLASTCAATTMATAPSSVCPPPRQPGPAGALRVTA